MHQPYFCSSYALHLFLLTWYRLSTSKAGIHRPPEIKLFWEVAACPANPILCEHGMQQRLANYFRMAKGYWCLPGDTRIVSVPVTWWKKELILRGIFPSRILLEKSPAPNTRSEAFDREDIGKDSCYAIWTSPELFAGQAWHLKKAGFFPPSTDFRHLKCDRIGYQFHW